ncbi:succinate dehydrogenase assembly factor 2 [Pikeienuella piscinae]|uniref:FAD assembly factor SdhE n=1 Tax=Pikeienuella piscinae TaxID=2748098 RepID=A0A7L5BXV5_9RHOB|nr:succinate dehydrogenase assembly factor 2 [Pikeienuella piscinae]QIE54724.1 succinate dehydrogenase assembly factor 2 [Pikeienuella piscinae]
MATAETAANRLRRLSMRSWRRGMKEMDLILGRFADARLAALGESELAAYEALLGENDQDLYLWVSGGAPTPAHHESIVGIIAGFHGIQR